MYHLQNQMATQQDQKPNDEEQLPNNILMKKDILSMKENLLSTFSNETLQLLHGRGEGYDSQKRSRHRGGAIMTVKRALQKNLNINWPDTMRNSLLFLFFGYFGSR